MNKIFDKSIVEAEENALIDFQFLVQELIMTKGMSRATVAQRASISEARLSQLLGSEANPTAKSLARVIHALGEEIAITIKKKLECRTADKPDEIAEGQWKWEGPVPQNSPRLSRKGRARYVAAVRESVASNDNHAAQVFFLEEGEQSLTLEAA